MSRVIKNTTPPEIDSKEFQMRAALVTLIQQRGDFHRHPKNHIRGATLLATVALEATATDLGCKLDAEERESILSAAHYALFNAPE